MSTAISTQDYAALLNDVRERIHGAQLQAHRAVNRELIGLYWDVGRMIVDRQERCKDDLQREFYLLMTRRMGWTRRVLVLQSVPMHGFSTVLLTGGVPMHCATRGEPSSEL